MEASSQCENKNWHKVLISAMYLTVGFNAKLEGIA